MAFLDFHRFFWLFYEETLANAGRDFFISFQFASASACFDSYFIFVPGFIAKQSARGQDGVRADTRNYNYNLASVYPPRPGLISLLSVFSDSRFLIIVNLRSRTNETIHKFNFCAANRRRSDWNWSWSWS